MASLQALADRLRSAYEKGAVEPLRDGLEPQDGEAAYKIQNINTRFWLEQGRRVLGRKIGLTAKAVQQQLGVDQPDFGVLFDDTQIQSGGVLDMARTSQPKAEAEVAFVLGRDLDGANLTADVVSAAIDHVCAAIEIVDSRIADWRISFADTVADNGSAAFFVLGEEKQSYATLDLENCKMALTQNGETVSNGVGSACLGHPINAAVWLANTVAAHGAPLKAGEVILTGALGPMVPIAAGDVIAAEVQGLGRVSFHCGSA